MSASPSSTSPQARVFTADEDLRARRQRAARRNVGGAERGACVATGAALVGLGLRRGRLAGALLALTGSTLLYRGATGRSRVYRLLDVDTRSGEAGRGPVAVARAVTIAGDREALFRRLRPARELSEALLGDAADVREDGSFRLALHIPLVGPSEWEMERTEEEPPSRLVWRSRPVDAGRGEARLELTLASAPRDRGSELLARLAFESDAGWAATGLRGLRPVAERALGAGLARLKQRIETGEVATASGQPSGPRSFKRRAVGALAARARERVR